VNRRPIVVDTNVLLVAEGRSVYSRKCAAACADKLKQIQSQHAVVLDRGREILNEYGNKVPHTRQPGLGYYFWKWLVNTRAGGDHCVWVDLTADAVKGYVEFPDHEGLKHFDVSDRKFVAAAVAHPSRPKIVQAGDSKWWGWRDSLAECGIHLDFPCEVELKKKWDDKFGPHV
jgi:hypothetical protein